DNLLKWKRNTNTTTFVDYAESNGKKLMNSESPGNMEFDRLDRLWLRTNEHGVFVLNKNDRAIKNLVYDTSRASTLPSGWVTDIKQGPGNYMWLATDRGICKVNIHNFDIDNLNNSSLSKLKGISCYYLFFSDSNNLWIATIGKGLWHYSFTTDSIRIFNKEKGFISDNVFCINKDNDGNIYVGTEDGLQILLRNGNMKRITRKDGLMNSRVEALLLDKRNRMWIGNDVGIACFSIKDSTLRYFDETYGLSIQGFRLASYCHTSDDELLWGTEKGMQYFYPDELYNYRTELKININRLESRKIVANLTQSDTFHLASNDNYVTFSFSTIEYLTQLRTFYEYKLENLDADWIKVINQNSVRYSSIPPGTYTFKVRASNDGKTWKEAGNIITIIVAKTIWQQLWFRILGALIGILLIIFVIRFYKKKQAVQREELETQIVINYFASQINLHRKTEDILWDVAKNCISNLNFEDCVIYLLDENKNVLIQKAAYGPKVAKDFTIHQPIEIPVGKGIVGSVAQTGKAELISNTEQDARYIADDVRRYSELAVPLVIDNKVIGVIDSEHSRKNFFTKRHLNILSTVAVLCANQIQRARAEEEKQHAKIEALETRQKVTESRLQSLRLQMNPHFLFNALNSIQQMILGNEEMVATRYLSRFSKLLRTILIHSDKEMVTLKEELEILNLYVELEAIRFKESFRYSIKCDEDIDQDETKIPTLLVQPFVENAIWHGLMHKEGERRLLIHFFEKDDYLHCVIEDNGIGRAMSAKSKLAGGQNVMHTSKGISVSMERLRALANGQGSEKLLNIIDLSDDSGNASGTRVEIRIPILN
ncbi:MAG TPA: histidine kinase, partial [Chitinophagaceae bacterium]|nr:histidine kinase [Chitinophagaceae bacterium]